MAGGAHDGGISAAQLFNNLGGRCMPQQGVAVTVVVNLMPLGGDPARQFRMLFHELAGDKKCGWHPVAAQHIENIDGGRVVLARVKREHHLLTAPMAAAERSGRIGGRKQQGATRQGATQQRCEKMLHAVFIAQKAAFSKTEENGRSDFYTVEE